MVPTAVTAEHNSDVQMTGGKCTEQLRQHGRTTRLGAGSAGALCKYDMNVHTATRIARLPVVANKPRSYRTSCALKLVHLTREVSTRQFPRKMRDNKAVRSST